MSLTKVSFSLINGTAINIVDYGAVGDDSTDCTQAIQAAATAATTQGKALYIPSGVYKITDTIEIGGNTKTSVFGDSPQTSIIKNYGTNDALDLSQCNYYSTFENFSVDGSGNAASRDGISLYRVGAVTGNNVAYSHFFNVYSYDNGRHGFYHRQAWGTRYSQCKAHYNGACGYFLDTQNGDAGTHNGVSFFQCDARWNGGTSDYGTASYNSDAGGIKIIGGAGIYWIGGIIESNNPWGANVQGAAYAACRSVVFDDVYSELNGTPSERGGFLFAGSVLQDVHVRNGWHTVTSQTGNINYFIYNASTAQFEDANNFVYLTGGSGSEVYAAGFTNRPAQTLYSVVIGDTGSTGNSTTATVATVTADGLWTIRGFIHCRRNSDNTGGVYPFVVSYDSNVVGIKVNVGSSIVSSATTPPTIAINGSGPYTIDVTFAGYHYGHLELEDAGIFYSPTTLNYNQTIIPVLSTSSELMRRA